MPTTLRARLSDPVVDLAKLALQARRHPAWVDALLDIVRNDTTHIRLRASKVLRLLSGTAPQVLYPEFDFFASLLTHENSILHWNAIATLANLAAVDEEGKLDAILDAYLAPISGPRLVDAANTIRAAATIAGARPHLADRIAASILRVEGATYATPECRNIAIGQALRAFHQMLATLSQPDAVREFARRQVDNPRRATSRKAQVLLTR